MIWRRGAPTLLAPATRAAPAAAGPRPPTLASAPLLLSFLLSSPGCAPVAADCGLFPLGSRAARGSSGTRWCSSAASVRSGGGLLLLQRGWPWWWCAAVGGWGAVVSPALQAQIWALWARSGFGWVCLVAPGLSCGAACDR